ncbi:hypothetical protein QEG73_12775 [Chitinophagaceae bacterium 26-R-25]|nr:hypothetical protein [Chitinophagaceae bacterium 26-R-25]
MPIEYSVNIAYDDIYSDYATVDIKDLLKDIPTKMALTLVCHYTGQIHTQEKNPKFQLTAISDWFRRFDKQTIQKIQSVIDKFNAKQESNFNFINNVTSLYLIESLLKNKNDLPETKDLNPQQEENLFKAYLYYSAKWTKEQEAGAIKYKDVSIAYMGLVMLLPYSEIFEFKDFRMQFLKAVYFFKFCESNELFNGYLKAFLAARGLKNWNDYLFNLVSAYVTLLQKDSLKTVLEFTKESKDVFTSLEAFCVNTDGFKPVLDFLTLRETPLYKNSDKELLFLNINFLIDKIYQSIIFDFADILIKAGLTYNEKAITTKPQFFGIFGDEFIEPGLFYKIMQYVFRQKDYKHFTGDELKNKFGVGTPDYLIVDNSKIYVFEFKNAIFSGPVKYTFDIDKIIAELDKKLVKNEGGRPKGVTQLVNFIEDITKGRYESILGTDISRYIIYPILVTTDFTFNLPVIYSIVAPKFDNILKDKKLEEFKLNIRKLTMMDLDSLIKFQDLFIEKKLTINHVLNDYQAFLLKGTNPIDKSLSFHKYIHLRTSRMKYDTPKLFWTEVQKSLFKIDTPS